MERNTIQVLHAVSGALQRPEAEAVVVLGGDDDAFYAGLFTHARPLAPIQFSGVENFGAFPAVPPFQVGEAVDVEVHEGDGCWFHDSEGLFLRWPIPPAFGWRMSLSDGAPYLHLARHTM